MHCHQMFLWSWWLWSFLTIPSTLKPCFSLMCNVYSCFWAPLFPVDPHHFWLSSQGTRCFCWWYYSLILRNLNWWCRYFLSAFAAASNIREPVVDELFLELDSFFPSMTESCKTCTVCLNFWGNAEEHESSVCFWSVICLPVCMCPSLNLLLRYAV